METYIIIGLLIVIGILAERLFWHARFFSNLFTNKKTKIMKEQTSLFKQIVGFLLTIIAGWVGIGEAPEMFLSFGVILATVYVIVNLVKPYLSTSLVQVFSWAVGIILSMGGWYLQLGIFVDTTWIFAAVTGFIISLAANGVYDSEWLESLWRLIAGLFTRKQGRQTK